MAELQPSSEVNNSILKRKKTRSKKSKPIGTFILDSSNCQKLFADNKILQNTIKNINICHKFIIPNNLGFLISKKRVLEVFTNQCLPHLIIPTNIEFDEKSKNVNFHCSNCPAAIEKLISDNLILLFNTTEVNITLVVACTQQAMNPKNLLKKVLAERVSIDQPITANLHNLASIPGWRSKIYINLKAHFAINYLLNCVRNNHPTILELHDNDIESLKGWINYFDVDAVNLSNTGINSFEDLGPLLKMDIKRINLNGTPLRKQFSDQESFNQKLRQLFPNVYFDTPKKIDKITDKFTFRKHDNISENAEYLVDQFMEHYFHFYDEPKTKRYLEEMYHKAAIFSLTSAMVVEPDCSISERFKHHAHNVLDKSSTDFVVGPKEIIRKLCYLPNVVHVPSSFQVDITHYVENDKVIFTINGGCKQNENYYRFSRTFFLQAELNGEYKIRNDLLFITNKLPTSKPYFGEQYSLPITLNINIDGKLPFIAKNNAQRYGMTVVFIDVTRLHVQYATEILEKAHWNMRKALEIFIQDVRYDNFSYEHFLQDEIKQIVFNCLPSLKMGINVDRLRKMLENMQHLTEDRFILHPGDDNKILNKCKKDEVRKLFKV